MAKERRWIHILVAVVLVAAILVVFAAVGYWIGTQAR